MKTKLLLTLLLLHTIVFAQNIPFQFFGKSVAAGSKAQMLIPVTAGGDSTVIPITVFNGTKKGPVLGIIAGVHGVEYVPIVAAQQFSKKLNATQMSGTVILVHMANVAGFLGRSIPNNPLDNKNLNRVFPGKKDGTITERLAWVISNDIIARCNFVIDVHSGDGNNDLRPYSGYYNYFDNPTLAEKGKQMAAALGFNYVVQFGNEQSINEASKYSSREAIVRNIPAVDIECGRMGLVEMEFVDKIVSALFNLTYHTKILEGKPAVQVKPYFIQKRTSVDSEHTGFFYSNVSAGEFVKKGMTLGHVTDLFGNHLTDIISPVDGMILYMTSSPPISKGEGLFSIGHIN